MQRIYSDHCFLGPLNHLWSGRGAGSECVAHNQLSALLCLSNHVFANRQHNHLFVLFGYSEGPPPITGTIPPGHNQDMRRDAVAPAPSYALFHASGSLSGNIVLGGATCKHAGPSPPPTAKAVPPTVQAKATPTNKRQLPPPPSVPPANVDAIAPPAKAKAKASFMLGILKSRVVDRGCTYNECDRLLVGRDQSESSVPAVASPSFTPTHTMGEDGRLPPESVSAKEDPSDTEVACSSSDDGGDAARVVARPALPSIAELVLDWWRDHFTPTEGRDNFTPTEVPTVQASPTFTTPDWGSDWG